MSEDAEVLELAAGRALRPKKPPVEIERGVSSGLPFSSFTDWVTGKQIAPNTNLVTIDQLIEMRQKDGTTRALLRYVTLPIIQSLKEAEFVGPEEGGADKEVEFCNQMFTLPPQSGGMTVPLAKFMKRVLLGVFDGFAAFEEVRQIPEDGPLKGKVVLKKMAHRDPRTIQFLVDDHGGFDGLKQTAMVKGERKEIPIAQEDSWYWACNEEENAFYGVSMFEAAWHHWDIKRKLYYIAHIAAQMAAVPGRMGTVPRNATPNETAQFLKMLGDFAFNTAGVKLTDFEVEFTNMNSNFDFMKLIDHQNAQMAKSVLAKFLEEPDRAVLIDNSGSDGSADFFVMSIESIMNEIAENITHFLIPKYIDWNFGSGKYPEFHFGALSDASKDVIKDLFTVIGTAQSSMWTPEFIREMEKKLTDRLGLDVDYEEVDKREEEEKQQQEDLQAAYQQQQNEAEGGVPQPDQPGQSPFGGGAAGGGKPPRGAPAVAAASAGGTATIEDFADRMIALAQRRMSGDGPVEG